MVWKVGILLFDDEKLLQKVVKNIARIFISKLSTIYTYLKLKITSSEQFLKADRDTYVELGSYIYPYVSLMIGLMISLFHFKKQEISLSVFFDGHLDEVQTFERFCLSFFEDSPEKFLDFLVTEHMDIWLKTLHGTIYLNKNKMISIMASIFFDQFGEPFIKTFFNWDKFLIDKIKVEKVREIVFNRKIIQEIFYESQRNSDNLVEFD